MSSIKEKYKYLGKNTLIFAISSFSTKFLSFLLVPLYTSFLSTAEYGKIDLITTTSTLLVYVLTINIADSVLRFTIENEDLTDSRGQAVGNMTADTFAEFTGTEPDAYCSNTFTLYFTDKSGQKLVKEQRTVRYKRSIPKERIVLEQLMKGPLEKGHYPTIPENTEVLNVTIADRICYVAFDGVFSSYALDVSEKIPVYSVVNSLLDALDADKVQITVGGKDRLDTFGKKMELYHFYERNDKLVVKEKE